MNRFFQNQTLLKNLLPVSTIFLFLMISGLFAHPNSSNPGLSKNELLNKRLKVYQASTMVIKNASDVHLNLTKATRWANAGIDERKINLLGEEQLARLEGVDKMIKKTLLGEWPTPEEKTLYEAILNDFENYRNSCILTIRTATSNLQMTTTFRVADDHFKQLHGNLQDLLDLETRLSPEIAYHPHRAVSAASRTFCRPDEGSRGTIRANDRMNRQAYSRSF